MACMVPAISSKPSLFLASSRRCTFSPLCGFDSLPGTVFSSGTFSGGHQYFYTKLSHAGQRRGHFREILKPISAASAGLEASMAEPLDDIINFKNVEIAVESEDTDRIQLKVDLNGAETQKAFDIVLMNLARSAPPIPGFRREKGGYFLNPQFTYERHDYNIREDEEVMRGVKKVIQRLDPNIDNQIRALNELEIYSLKQEDFSDIVTQRAVKFTNPGKTSKVPKSILLDMLGEERVIKFVMREIVTSTISTYSKKENLSVKENKVSTVQTEDELKKLFSPGSAFGFSAVLELENAAVDTTS